MSTPLFIGFDIETRPVVDNVDRFVRPFSDFDEATVKFGNTKDPEKRKALVESKRSEHAESSLDYWRKARDRAALDPFTGAIVCIGIITDESGPEIICEKTEAATLRQFWQIFSLSANATTRFVFWSGCGDPAKKFDIDYIVTRSRINRVPVPGTVFRGRYYADRIVDLASMFLLHQRDRYLKLTKAAEMLDLYADHKDIFPKRDDDPVRGENFWQWWDGVMVAEGDSFVKTPAEQRHLAETYLANDLLHLKYLTPLILG